MEIRNLECFDFEDRALINRFGLNEGAGVVSKRMELWREKKPQNGIVGVKWPKQQEVRLP